MMPAQPAMYIVYIKHWANVLCDMTFNFMYQVSFPEMCNLAAFISVHYPVPHGPVCLTF
jgi:hypothetical protein